MAYLSIFLFLIINSLKRDAVSLKQNTNDNAISPPTEDRRPSKFVEGQRRPYRHRNGSRSNNPSNNPSRSPSYFTESDPDVCKFYM